MDEDDIFGSASEDEDMSPPVSQNIIDDAVPSVFANKEKSSMSELFGESDDENVDRNNDDMDEIFGTNSEKFDSNVAIKEKIHVPNLTKFKKGTCNISVTMPNFVNIKTEPYDSKTYDIDKEHERFSQAASLIRWRFVENSDGETVLDANGKPKIESNARLVKFTDGTYQIVIDDEIVGLTLFKAADSFAYSLLKSNSSHIPEEEGEIDKEVSNASCLEGLGSIQYRMTLNPISLHSKAHIRTSKMIKEKFQKSSKLKEKDTDTITIHPYLDMEMRARQVMEELRKERKQKEQREQESGGGGYRRASMSSSFLEQDLDGDNGMYDSTSLAAIKGKKSTAMHQTSTKKLSKSFKALSRLQDDLPLQKKRKDLSNDRVELSNDYEDDDDEDEGEEDDNDDDGSEMNDFIVKDEEEEDDDNEASASSGSSDDDDDNDEDEGGDADKINGDDNSEESQVIGDSNLRDEKTQKKLKKKHKNKLKEKKSQKSKSTPELNKRKNENSSETPPLKKKAKSENKDKNDGDDEDAGNHDQHEVASQVRSVEKKRIKRTIDSDED